MILNNKKFQKITSNIYANRSEIRYLVAGLWNTIFGYMVGIVIYNMFNEYIGIIIIGIITSILSITMAFLTYKLFVFRTNGNWWAEYLRAYLVYGFTSALSVAILWVLVDFMNLPFWLGQGIAIGLTIIFSYVSHARFTFKS